MAPAGPQSRPTCSPSNVRGELCGSSPCGTLAVQATHNRRAHNVTVPAGVCACLSQGPRHVRPRAAAPALQRQAVLTHRAQPRQAPASPRGARGPRVAWPCSRPPYTQSTGCPRLIPVGGRPCRLRVARGTPRRTARVHAPSACACASSATPPTCKPRSPPGGCGNNAKPKGASHNPHTPHVRLSQGPWPLHGRRRGCCPRGSFRQ